MVKKFLSLQWKQLKRSPAFEQKLITKIFMALFALYFIACFSFMGIAAYFIIKKEGDGLDPLFVVNSALIYYFIVDLLIRFFMQKLPVLDIKPLLVLPIKRRISINFLLAKGLVSFFNLLPLFFYIPFTIVLLIEGYDVFGVTLWFMSMLAITCTVNFINFLINKNNLYFVVIVGVLATFIGLAYYGYFDAAPYVGSFLNGIYTNYYYALLPFGLLALFYYINYNFLRKDFYLDGSIKKKVQEVKTTELTFLDRFGKVAPFLKNDIKMIWRNKRPKQVVFISILFVGYGLIFFTQSVYDNQLWIKPFIAMFITGGFLMTFGQNVPSWDSEYYNLMMSQNIKYRTYLESKWYLMVVATFISFILAIPYVYFGMDILYFVIAGACFNIGLNSFVVLWGGVFNKTAIPLNEKAKAFSNTQAFNASMLLIALPKLLLPIVIFLIPYLITNDLYTGVICLGASGVVGILFKKPIFKFIEKQYQKQKYATVAAYKKKN
ncbi:hypothetical protein NBRC110019_19140 [Neptunitalea chrysea]|uniref:Uncharacterized protein n=1 Tax=Neptunitalea chrysea TaxID=1647581 RepID=A0A9W6B7V4_9FLAO|nr:DUF5687 family protein [Neptunitalea chrysea]GLB52874.1 hypothetical protein NBRC110019_19140 [Neptunitalea chrysea]